MTMKADETAIYLHIPKNGGTTTQSYVRKVCDYPSQYHIKPNDVVNNTLEFYNLPQSDKLKVKLVRGHIKFGFHELVQGESKYISILRDPVDRTISQYFHAKRHPHHAHYRAITEKGLTILDYIDPNSNYIKSNMQTRYITGVGNRPLVELGFEQYAPVTGLNNEYLTSAFDNIKQKFSVVGILEDLPGFVANLNKYYNKNIEYVSKVMNANPNKYSDEQDITASIKKSIMEVNSLDVALYSFVKNLN